MSPQRLFPADPKGLESYFTDSRTSGTVQELFRQVLAAPTLSKRLLVIHGIGGVGKSALLQMLCLHCKRANVPVARTILHRLREVLFIRRGTIHTQEITCPGGSGLRRRSQIGGGLALPLG